MKAWLLIGATVLAVVAAAPSKADDLCDGISKLATTVMHARQNGADMAKMMSIASKPCTGKSGDDLKLCNLLRPIQQSLVVEAYKQPRYSTTSYQEKATSDFANSMYLACYESEHKSS